MLRARAAVTAALLAAGAFMAPSSALADASAPLVTGAPPVSSATGQQIVTSGQAQCTKPVGSRSGAWACPVAPVRVAAAAEHGFCTFQGCWTFVDSARTTHKANVTYGYGKSVVGTGTFYFKTTSSGGLNVSDWYYFVASRGTAWTKLEVERLYLSAAHPAGHTFSPRLRVSATCAPKSANIKCRYASGKARTFDNRVASYTIKHTATWKDVSSAYPGRWFIMAKSVKYKRSSSGLSYIADSKARRPDSPATSGYLP